MTLAMMKLGKLAPKEDARTLKLSNYLDIEALPPPPLSTDWAGKVPAWGMMYNDSIGDCTCAAAGHMEMSWSADSGAEYVPPNADILAVYEAISGYKPDDPANPQTNASDTGCVAMDVLNYWRKNGIAGKKITAYMSVNPRTRKAVEQAIFLFGGIYVGISMPISAQDQKGWFVTTGPDAEPGSWGGHAVPVLAYDEDGLTCVTWGQLMHMSWEWFFTYVDEAYAVLSSQWCEENGEAPNHFNLAQLQADLSAIG